MSQRTPGTFSSINMIGKILPCTKSKGEAAVRSALIIPGSPQCFSDLCGRTPLERLECNSALAGCLQNDQVLVSPVAHDRMSCHMLYFLRQIARWVCDFLSPCFSCAALQRKHASSVQASPSFPYDDLLSFRA